MPRTITLNTIRLESLQVHHERRYIQATYALVDAQGKAREHAEAYFWETLPEPPNDLQGEPGALPPNYHALPARYSGLIADLAAELGAFLQQRLDAEEPTPGAAPPDQA